MSDPTVRLNTRLPESLRRAVRVAAAEQDLSLAEFCQAALREKLATDVVPEATRAVPWVLRDESEEGLQFKIVAQREHGWGTAGLIQTNLDPRTGPRYWVSMTRHEETA